ncbi:Nucleotide-binding universal stress protein, UspA family [Desulfocicer vacuolatum DSM 3385]|uniref:Nucleotide-binding universal stress protein, UspA family n=1 Tax=Desulfocicer vacuolatum DSM 3385 TaxID=1121400 RepID=A0A1W2DQ56_9BACT|nr:universal stress protein [Desulfocicer vacuolatum]SMC99564.1 Nucleotide-binding universal stress protein, UspA family [Desulfocicer vacuolatum DSM 3385]
MSEYKDKLLVVLDGSERSFKTIEYLCDFKPFIQKEIVLFNVFNSVPESYWDMSSEAFSRNAMAQAKGWELQRRKEMEDYMERAKSLLESAGYSRTGISICIKNRKKGVARDIIAEASKGYFAVLARRRGYGALLHVVMGSTTTKLVENLSSVPVLLAGLNRINNAIFLTVDGSEGSNRAVDFTANLVKDSQCRIVLCSVLRDFEHMDISSENAPAGSAEYVQSFFNSMQSAVDEAAEKLKAAGIKSEQIQRKIITGTKTRAGSIAKAAEDEGCDTIVLGRRGKSNVQDFGIGRVPWKVIHAARKMTVWIVS